VSVSRVQGDHSLEKSVNANVVRIRKCHLQCGPSTSSIIARLQLQACKLRKMAAHFTVDNQSKHLKKQKVDFYSF